MKAMRLYRPGGLDQLILDDRLAPAPPPGQGEVRVRIRSSSLNYHDFVVVTGGTRALDRRIPMSDAGGEVVELGAGVETLALGDSVCSLFFPDWLQGRATAQNLRRVPGDSCEGFACEEVTLPASAFTRAPAGYTHVEAATLPCAALTAWRALIVDGGLQPGDRVLVQGSGGVSVFALQFAKAAGATVIATSSSNDKLERLEALGADHLINFHSKPDWSASVRSLTDGRGVDHIVEVGGGANLEQSIAACAMGGHIAQVGVLSGYSATLSTARLMASQIRLQGLTVGSREHQLAMISAIEANNIRPVIDSEFALEDLAEAFQRLASRRHVGKICVAI